MRRMERLLDAMSPDNPIVSAWAAWLVLSCDDVLLGTVIPLSSLESCAQLPHEAPIGSVDDGKGIEIEAPSPGSCLMQLRGVVLEDADKIMQGLVERGLSSVMSGMDNVRNITGSPIAGIDPHELLDSRPLCHGKLHAML